MQIVYIHTCCCVVLTRALSAIVVIRVPVAGLAALECPLCAAARTDICANPGFASKTFENQSVPHGHASHGQCIPRACIRWAGVSYRRISYLTGVHVMGIHSMGHASHRRVSHGHMSHRRVPYPLHGGHLVQSCQYLAFRTTTPKV